MDGADTPFWADTLHRQRGDMLCLLGFSRRGEGVQVTTRYFQIGYGLLNEVNPFVLRRRA